MILTHGANSLPRGGGGMTVNIGGRDYPVVQIGNQLWLAENLDFKFDVNGSQIPIGASGTSTSPQANYYDNDESTYGVNGNKYGLLYNWYAVKYLEDNKSSLLPTGWHVSTPAEWNALATAVGGTSVAGTKLKSTTDWSSGAGTDDYGFSAFPAGSYNGSFYNLGIRAYFWTARAYDGSFAYRVYLGTSASMNSYNDRKYYQYSVRLVKDA